MLNTIRKAVLSGIYRCTVHVGKKSPWNLVWRDLNIQIIMRTRYNTTINNISINILHSSAQRCSTHRKASHLSGPFYYGSIDEQQARQEKDHEGRGRASHHVQHLTQVLDLHTATRVAQELRSYWRPCCGVRNCARHWLLIISINRDLKIDHTEASHSSKIRV